MIQYSLGEAEENAQYTTQGRVTEAMKMRAVLGPGKTVSAELCISISK